ncbi:hypothetical protein PG999_010854 [Apiospora kogelbergensis]|uniref:C2H2-type domain-containing protein n=1 Tax=Apiospora kogelbergensis TaxID=1337665 RepID=A0AAW0QBC2_9PEZI
MAYYSGSERYDEDWEGDASMGDGEYGIFLDLAPNTTIGEDGIDPNLLMYPPATNTDGEQNAHDPPATAPYSAITDTTPYGMATYEQPPNGISGGTVRYRFDETPMPPLDNHRQEKNGTYMCNRSHKGKACTKAFKRKTELQKHLKTHDKPVYCPFYNDPHLPCDKGRAAEQRDMERHVVSHHRDWAKQNGIVAEQVYCSCGEEFTREDNLRKHQTKYGHQ